MTGLTSVQATAGSHGHCQGRGVLPRPGGDGGGGKVQLLSYTPLSTGLLYPKLRAQTSGIIQKLYETKTNTNTG